MPSVVSGGARRRDNGDERRSEGPRTEAHQIPELSTFPSVSEGLGYSDPFSAKAQSQSRLSVFTQIAHFFMPLPSRSVCDAGTLPAFDLQAPLVQT